MAYPDDLRSQWRHLSTVVQVTYTPPDGGAADTDVRAEIGDVSYREAMMAGQAGLEPTDKVWTIWAETCTAAPVQRGTITYDGATWQVLSVIEQRVATALVKYRCVCRKQV